MRGCEKIYIKKVVEGDGILYVMENEKELPFDIKRIFLVSNVVSGKSRGDHATKKTRLVLFAVSGSCNVIVDNGVEKESFLLNKPEEGLLIEPMVWRSMTDFSNDCVMMAACDSFFSPGDETFDNYEEYLSEVYKRDTK